MNREHFIVLARKATSAYLSEAYNDIRKSILDFDDLCSITYAIFRMIDILSYLLEKDGVFEDE